MNIVHYSSLRTLRCKRQLMWCLHFSCVLALDDCYSLPKAYNDHSELMQPNDNGTYWRTSLQIQCHLSWALDWWRKLQLKSYAAVGFMPKGNGILLCLHGMWLRYRPLLLSAFTASRVVYISAKCVATDDHVDGVTVRLWTTATSGPIVHPSGDIWSWINMVESSIHPMALQPKSGLGHLLWGFFITQN
jgi:hypothetical protein